MSGFDAHRGLAPREQTVILDALAARQRSAGLSPIPTLAGEAVVLDNGSGVLRVGYAKTDEAAASLELSDAGDLAGATRQWAEAFAQLGASPRESPTLLVLPTHINHEQREAAATLAFEQLGVPALYLARSAALTLYASGSITGVVVEARGHERFSVAISGGLCLSQGIVRSRGGSWAEAILRAAEASGEALATVLAHAVIAPDTMASKVDLPEVIEELRTLVPAIEPQVYEHEHENPGAWHAGAVLARDPEFRALWISKDEYDASGPGIVRRKCDPT